MRLVIQRVSEAAVRIEGNLVGQIEMGLLILAGITPDDTEEDIRWISRKVVQMRIFGDDEGKMNRSVQDIAGNILLISQFTLMANTKKGNRPSFIEAAPPALAIPLYEKLISELESELGKKIATGLFGADMKVSLINDGPVTIIIDSKNRS
ncbi:D-tyrosyl-tRNA(Tyr) deacylase [Adhaeribacter arboris]|uniref:D-aminoacyl-tRNA deacylase n=1 Tax=Adhaeribacter arboris TaxID=2072846 RepID=A0A2T2YCX9_9BACT|nr:D-aminoacyl-tRNA deacylase [Adhaeribacter arboris]PSR53380.1 D-tyrosyl-tRNA(Tyr) deacylase [Adhaeribacter arboris]